MRKSIKALQPQFKAQDSSLHFFFNDIGAMRKERDKTAEWQRILPRSVVIELVTGGEGCETLPLSAGEKVDVP